MKHLARFVAVSVFAVFLCSTIHAQSNPLVGTWKLNLEKSKYEPGSAPKSLTRTIVPAGDGVTYTFSGVAADGKPISYGFTVAFDGKDSPITGSIPNGADTIAGKRTDPNHYVATLKKGGKVIGESRVAVSADGKVTTVVITGTTAAGTKIHEVQVYDKQ
jgi:hypothetical protein